MAAIVMVYLMFYFVSRGFILDYIFEYNGYISFTEFYADVNKKRFIAILTPAIGEIVFGAITLWHAFGTLYEKMEK